MDKQSKTNFVYTLVALATTGAAVFLVVRFVNLPSFMPVPVGAVRSVPDLVGSIGGVLWSNLPLVIGAFWVLLHLVDE